MRRFPSGLRVALLWLLAIWPAPGQTRPAVLLISIDSLMPDYVLQADRYGLHIPNLRRVAEEGTYAAGVKGVVPTVTYPSHTTILSGVSPAKHASTPTILSIRWERTSTVGIGTPKTFGFRRSGISP